MVAHQALAVAFEPDARARAVLRGRQMAMEDLQKAGGTYRLEEVCLLLGQVSRQVVERRVREGRLLAVPGPSNRRLYPTLQFDAEGDVEPWVEPLLAAYPSSNPWALLHFLVNPDDRLNGRRPIDVLRAGGTDLVVTAARAMAQQGA